MNRAMRRAAARAAGGVLKAREVCGECFAPICPSCGVETASCGDCGGFNCEVCGSHVDPPTVFVVPRTGHTLH